MREIKFRAWNKERKFMFRVGDNFGTSHPLDCCVYAIQKQPVILMQFTGLIDRNLKEIWEGDILHYYMDSGKKYLWTVGFENGCFALLREFRGGTPRYFCEDISGFEVLGNIYESPELLKNAGEKEEKC